MHRSANLSQYEGRRGIHIRSEPQHQNLKKTSTTTSPVKTAGAGKTAATGERNGSNTTAEPVRGPVWPA
jgi:hypothetical protein